MKLPETRAWIITEANTSILKNITNVDERAFKGAIGWVLVEDWSEKPRFLRMPESIFHQYYPNLELSVFKVDEVVEPVPDILDYHFVLISNESGEYKDREMCHCEIGHNHWDVIHAGSNRD